MRVTDAKIALLLVLLFDLTFSGKWDTDFRNGKPGVWRNVAGDEYAWTPTRGLDVGPAGDHTTGGGAFVYVMSRGKAGRGWLFGDKWIPPKTMPRCLHFYYAFFGESRSSLMVTLKPNKREYYPVFIVNSTEHGELKDHWLRGDVQLTGKMKRRTAGFKANFKNGYEESGIALDDISMTLGMCECQDSLSELCPSWEKKGACLSNYRWMSKFCRKSCKTCSCSDSNSWCVGWMLEGKCKDPDIEFKCPYSCSVCHCRDNFRVCSKLKEFGYCKKDPKFMKMNCQKSCLWCPKDLKEFAPRSESSSRME